MEKPTSIVGVQTADVPYGDMQLMGGFGWRRLGFCVSGLVNGQQWQRLALGLFLGLVNRAFCWASTIWPKTVLLAPGKYLVVLE